MSVSPRPDTELQPNSPRNQNNGLMNTRVVFYFSLPVSILLTVIKGIKSTQKGHLFGSFSSRLGWVMEWNMTHQFNYRLTIVWPLYKYWFQLLSTQISFQQWFASSSSRASVEGAPAAAVPVWALPVLCWLFILLKANAGCLASEGLRPLGYKGVFPLLNYNILIYCQHIKLLFKEIMILMILLITTSVLLNLVLLLQSASAISGRIVLKHYHNSKMPTSQCDLPHWGAASGLAWTVKTQMLTFPGGNVSITLILWGGRMEECCCRGLNYLWAPRHF